MKCPRLYYLSQVAGLQVREQFQSDALKIGKAVDGYITSGGEDSFEYESNAVWSAKASAIIFAFKELGFGTSGYTGQAEFNVNKDDMPKIRGYIDLSGLNHYIELKCTSRPDYYTNPYWIHDQMGTYFIANEDYEYGVVWAIRTPQLKRAGQFRDESIEDHRARCISDMLKRPAYYFTGYNRKDGTFGVRFYRGEFDINFLIRRYRWVAGEIQRCAKNDFFYQNRTQCLSPFQCDFISVCDTGEINEDVYEYRKEGTPSDIK